MIEKILKDSRYEDEMLTIDFSLEGEPISGIDPDETEYNLVSCKVRARNKTTGEVLQTVVDLIKLPTITPAGVKIKGMFKQVVTGQETSHGWYFNPADNKFKSKYLSSRAKGFSVKIFVHNGILKIRNDKKELPLAVFLKAITRKSYQELALLLGPENLEVALSFDPKDEPSLTYCMRETLTNLLDRKGRRTAELSSMKATQLDLEIKRVLFNTNYVDMGDSCYVRLKNSISFETRCKGMFLEEEVKVNGFEFEKGMTLTAKELEKLDYLPVKELKVSSLEKKEFISRKYHSHNFQVLGRELAEDIVIESKKIPAGTVLTVPIIKQIEETPIRTIVVKSGKVVEHVSRSLTSNEFNKEDFIGVLQVYIDFLNGIKKEDNVFSQANQSAINLDIKVSSLIRQNCDTVVRKLKDEVFSPETSDLLNNALFMERVNVDGILNYIKDPTTKTSQQAEVNNTLQRKSKDYRISRDTKHSTESMTSIHGDQYGPIDGLDTPESSKVGLTQTITIFSRINSYGSIESPFIRVENGVPVSDERVYLSTEKQIGTPYAEWNETFFTEDENGNKIPKPLITCILNGEFVDVPFAEVSYMQYSPYDTLSPARASIALLNHSALKRQTMGSNHVKSTHSSVTGERPLVSSGGDSLIDDGIFKVKTIVDSLRQTNSVLKGMTDEEIKGITLVLKDKIYRKDEMILVLHEKNKGFDLHFSVPHMIKSASGGAFNSRVNSYLSEYGYNDIVAYTVDYDIRSYKKEMFTDFGNMKPEEGTFDKAFGMGKNLCVAFKTMDSSTIDDSILISSELVGTDALTSILMHVESYELRENRTDGTRSVIETEEFTHLKGQMFRTPARNSIVLPGAEVLRINRVVKNASTGEIIDSHPESIRYDGLEEAQVVFAMIKNNKAYVLLIRTNSIEEGDKLSGRHGSKSVIAKIVPRQYMPYCPRTGLTVQVIINPLSIPSRTNVSIPIEAIIAFASKLEDKVTIITPFKDNVLDYALEVEKKHNLYPRTLVDGRTGIPYDRPVNIAYMYMYKSEHMVDKKIKAVGDNTPIDPTFGQPSKGDGAQALGEMETWAFSKAGANRFLDNAFSVASSDHVSLVYRNDQIVYGDPNRDIKGNNSNDEVIQILYRSLATEVELNADGSMVFRPLTSRMIRSLHSFPIPLGAKDKLRSEEIFGLTKAKLRDRSRWGWFELGANIVHPYTLIKGKLHTFITHYKMERKAGKAIKYSHKRVSCTRNDLINLVYSRALLYFDDEGNPIFISRDLLNSWEQDIRKSEHIVEDTLLSELVEKGSYKIGMDAVNHLFENTNLEETLEFLKKDLETENVEKKRKTSIAVGRLESFMKSGVKLSDYIIDAFPVMPIAMRPESTQHMATQDFDHYYGLIMDAAERCDKSPNYNPSLVKDLCERICDFVGTSMVPESRQDPSKTKYKSLLRTFSSSSGNKKKGALREHVAKTRVRNSGRTVIIPSSDPKRTVREIGLPLHMVLTIWRTQIVSLLIKEFEQQFQSLPKDWDQLLDVMGISIIEFKLRYKSNLYLMIDITPEEMYSIIYKKVADFMEGKNRFNGVENVDDYEVTLAGRQPTLHVFGVRAYRPYLVNHKCIEIHPLVCPAYNADFDGDQMYVVMVHGRKAKEEALKTMSPEYSTLNPKDGSIVLKPSQDIVLGLYYLTIMKDNVSHADQHEFYNSHPRHYSSLGKLETDLIAGVIKAYDPVILNKMGKLYASTAGRILLNSYLPENSGFTNQPFENFSRLKNLPNYENLKALRFDGVVGSPKDPRGDVKYSKLNDVIMYVIDNFGSTDYIDFSQRLSEAGFYFADRSGVSICLADFNQRDNTTKILDKADLVADKIKRSYRLGLLSEEERKSGLINLYGAAHAKIKKDYLENIDVNSNIYIMYDSGARGDAGQITQACAMVGVLQKSKTSTLEMPIKNSFIKGLSCYETLGATHSARMGVVSTQNETGDAGALTRQGIYMVVGVKIVENDCGVGFHKTKMDFSEFSNKIAHYTPKPKEELIGLVGLKIKPTPRKTIKDFYVENNIITEELIDQLIENRVFSVETDKGKFDLFNSSLLELKDLVGKKVVGSEDALKYIKYFSEGDKLTLKNINILVKNKVQFVQTEDSWLQFLYKPTKLFESLYLYREAINLPHLMKGKFISKETLKYLSETQPEYFEVRDMLRCNSVGGVCQKCYGAEFDTRTYPRLGYGASIGAAQAVGEPAAQITMNVSHKGGSADQSGNGVDFLSGLMGQGHAGKNYVGPPVAPVSGYLVNDGPDRKIMLHPDEGETIPLTVNEDHWVVTNEGIMLKPSAKISYSVGEYVKRNQVLDAGIPQTRKDLIGEHNETFYFNQLNLLRWYFETFEKSNIALYARHLELFARVQTSMVTVINSDTDEAPIGSFMSKSQLDKMVEEGHRLEYQFHRESSLKLIQAYAGPLTAMIHGDLGATLGEYITSQQVSKGDNPIMRIVSGQPLSSKKLKPFKKIELSENVYTPKEWTEIDVDTSKVLDDIMQETRVAEVTELGEFDLDALLNEPTALELDIEPTTVTRTEDNTTREELKAELNFFRK